MKKELTLEHIALYLAYGLNLQFSYEDDTEQNVKRGLLTDVYTIDDDVKLSVEHMDDEHIWMFKPILRPMSDLTMELVNELLPKMHITKRDIEEMKSTPIGHWKYYQVVSAAQMHIDFRDLIEKGLAVNLNTIEQ